MKKVYSGSVLVLIALLLTFFGCGGGGGSSSTPIVENSSYGDYAIAGISYVDTQEDESSLLRYETAALFLRGQIYQPDYYLIHYDSADPFAWLAVSANTSEVLKLVGMNADNSINWIALQNEDIMSFIAIGFDSSSEQIQFGDIFQEDDELSTFVTKVANHTFKIEGMILQYAKNDDTAWVYVTFDARYTGLLDGKSADGLPLWGELYTEQSILNSKYLLREDPSNKQKFDNVSFAKEGGGRIYWSGDGTYSKTMKISPETGYAMFGDSATFSVEVIDNITGDITSPEETVWESQDYAYMHKAVSAVSSSFTVTCSQSLYFIIACLDGDMCIRALLYCDFPPKISVHGPARILLNASANMTAIFSANIKGVFTEMEPKNDSLIWKSSNVAIAGVNAEGVVTCRSEGEASVSATYTVGNITGSKSIECVGEFTTTLSGPGKLFVKQDAHFIGKVVKKNKELIKDVEFDYSVEGSFVANIGERSGLLYCLEEGDTVVSVKAKNIVALNTATKASQPLQCLYWKPRFYVQGYTPLKVKETAQYDALRRTVFGNLSNETRKSIWSSKNTAVATVGTKTGKVTCQSVGSAVIKAFFKDENDDNSKLIFATQTVTCLANEASSSSTKSSSSSNSSEVSSSSTESSSSSSIPEVSSSSSLSSSSNSSEGSTSSSDYTGTKTWVISPTAVGMSTFSIVDVRYTVTDFDNNAEKLEDKLITAECGFEVSSGSDVIDIKKVGDNLEITGKKDGTATITITIPSKYTDGADYVNKTIVVTVTGVS